MKSTSLKPFLVGLSLSILVLFSFFAGGLADRVFVIKPLDFITKRLNGQTAQAPTSASTTGTPISSAPYDPNSVADIAEQASQSVVTVSIKEDARPQPQQLPFGFFGFNQQMPFGLPGQGGQGAPGSQNSQDQQPTQQDIGTGFVVDSSGLIVTNKHVVADTTATYVISDRSDKEYQIANIYRDPTNDIAIIKINDASLKPLALGDSDKLRVGQPVIAIGTALGQFRHSVTTGVVSGVGRGITAGDPYAGDSESLDNVIQTDAAINPGNSGGPLIDSTGSVIGVNVAVSQNAQNIGFAIPINVIKTSLDNFNKTGQFNRPFLGVRYQAISQQAALVNEVPQGVYIDEVVKGSSAEAAGLKVGDIIIDFDGQSLKTNDLVKLINNRKIGDKVEVKYFRDGKSQTTEVTLKASS